MTSSRLWHIVAAASMLLAGCAWQGSTAAVSNAGDFRESVLECPALPLPGKRMPTCAVPFERLRAYGDQACAWVEAKPIAVAYNRKDYWNDPFHINNVAWDFANATRRSKTVPLALERSERTIIAAMAWRHLCPKFSNKYNDPPPVD